MKIKTSTWKETKIKDLRKKEKKASQREKTKRPEAIWTRPSGLKFFQIEEMKINDEELEEQGKGDFFLEETIWTIKGKKERNQEKQISKEKEMDKNYNAINKGKKKKEKRKKEGDGE